MQPRMPTSLVGPYGDQGESAKGSGTRTPQRASAVQLRTQAPQSERPGRAWGLENPGDTPRLLYHARRGDTTRRTRNSETLPRSRTGITLKVGYFDTQFDTRGARPLIREIPLTW